MAYIFMYILRVHTHVRIARHSVGFCDRGEKITKKKDILGGKEIDELTRFWGQKKKRAREGEGQSRLTCQENAPTLREIKNHDRWLRESKALGGINVNTRYIEFSNNTYDIIYEDRCTDEWKKKKRKRFCCWSISLLRSANSSLVKYIPQINNIKNA